MPQYADTRKSLKTHKLAPKKRFGQNFLVNRNTAEAIVHAANLSEHDTVVEVGVGLGALTLPLADKVKQVVGLEVDSGIVRFHEQEGDLPENVTLLHLDILKADFTKLAELAGNPLKILANLPYSISNPFIFKLIENLDFMADCTVMLQKEVAERLMAQPRTKEYGIPTVLLQSCSTITRLLTLKPAEFHPRPKVDSVVIRIDFAKGPHGQLQLPDFNRKTFTTIVRTTFNQRRKTILNTLSKSVLGAGFDKAECKSKLAEIIANAGLTPDLRPETITVMQFVKLAQSFEQHLVNR